MSTRPPSTTDAALRKRLARAHAALREGRAGTAEAELRALTHEYPGEPNAHWLLGAALLAQKRIEESLAVLGPLCDRFADFIDARVDLARALGLAGRPQAAREEVRRVLEKNPHHPRGWQAYADILVELGQTGDARVAFDRARLTDPWRQEIEASSAALTADDRKIAEERLRAILREDASHVAALCGLAELSLLADRGADAERLLRHALRQSPHHPLIWRGLVRVLAALGRLEEADAAARHLIEVEPDNPHSWTASAFVSTRLLRQEEALRAYEQAERLQPDEVRLRLSMGHIHKTLGRRGESEAAYKAVLAARPETAEAWWSLADLKNYRFSDAEIAAMRAETGREGVSRANAAQLHFALGKALEDRGQASEAFEHYARGNALRRLDSPFDIAHFERRSERIRAVFDAPFFAARAGCGNPDRAPIFVVGLPRSGSTLIEQILASHSQVEGTMELPNIITITHQFDDMRADRDGYPETVRGAPPGLFAALGGRYLAETAPLRPGRRPRFTDKLPNNFSHVGLIHLMLPGATIIDARRHPLDACLSTFKQHFAEGQSFSYDLRDLGRYYRCYLSMMDHWDAVLPGKVLHVQYEDMVRDPSTQIRRLLDHCALPFEDACLAFHENPRSVRTASAEQVRQPIYTSGVGYWRRFQSELAPLRESLGDCLERFAVLEAGGTSGPRP